MLTKQHHRNKDGKHANIKTEAWKYWEVMNHENIVINIICCTYH